MLTATGFLLQRGAEEAVALQLRGRRALWVALAGCQHTICITDKVQKGAGKICLSLKIMSRWEGANSHPNYDFSRSVSWVKCSGIHHTWLQVSSGWVPKPTTTTSITKERKKQSQKIYLTPQQAGGEEYSVKTFSTLHGYHCSSGSSGKETEGSWSRFKHSAPAQGGEQLGFIHTKTHLGHLKLAFFLKKATLRSCCSYLDLGESASGHHNRNRSKSIPKLLPQVAAEPGAGRGWCKGALVGSQ